MDGDATLQDLLRGIFEKCIHLCSRFEAKPEAWVPFIEKWTEISTDYHALIGVVLSAPQFFIDQFQAYCQAAYALFVEQWAYYSGQTSVQPGWIDDKRFNTPAWTEQPFFLVLSQHYLLLKKHIQYCLEYIDSSGYPEAKRVRFFMQHYWDALSPANFLLTNPELLAETIASQGRNLLRGFDHFLTDLDGATPCWKIPLTDHAAFEVGRNIAITPGKVVFRNELIELIQYTPQTQAVKAIPLLIIPPWINKYYILDLSSNNSFVRWLVMQGIVVFIISWRNPDKRHAALGLADYVTLGPLAAIAVIQAQLQVATISALGFCIGGTLLALVLAYNRAQQSDVISCATFLASLIDFKEPGDLGVFMNEQQIRALEKRMQQQGYLEGAFMASAFNSLRATELIWAHFIRHYLQGKPPAAFDLLFWNSDTTNMPAKMHSEYLRWMYLNNDLVKPGKIMINQTPIDVQRIDIPTFFLSTQKDHIAPWQSTYHGFRLLGGKKRFVLAGSGHIAGIVMPPGQDKYGYYTRTSYPQDPHLWFNKARHTPGSWWPAWLKWLKKHSGCIIPAPSETAWAYPPLADAPGTYVHDK